jgi:hypothetical protein
MQNLIRLLLSGRYWYLLFLIGILVCSCAAPSERLHPRFSNHRQSMGAMLVLSPEIRIVEQMPNGGQLFQESLSQEAQRNAQASIAQELRDRAFTVRTMDAQPLQQADVNEVTKLFRSVNHSIQLHTFGPQIYPAKLDDFEYSVGPVAELLKAEGADGLVIAIGYQIGSEKPDTNWFSIAVVEPQGSVIWYNLTSMPQHFNLQHQEDISALVAQTMQNFWEQGS